MKNLLYILKRYNQIALVVISIDQDTFINAGYEKL